MSRDVSSLVWCRFATSSNWYAVDVSTGADSLRSQNDMSGHVSSGADRLRFETGMTADVSSVADWLHVKFQSPIR